MLPVAKRDVNVCEQIQKSYKEEMPTRPWRTPTTVMTVLVTLLLLSFATLAAASRGIVGLDEYTFHHVVGGNSPVLVKFDRKYAVDREMVQFAADASVRASGLVLAEVEVEENAEDSDWNEKLHHEFAGGRDLALGPSFCLFKRKSKECVLFTGASKDLMAWVNTKLGILSPGGGAGRHDDL